MSGTLDRILPSERSDRADGSARLVGLDSEEGAAVVEALSARTARELLVALRERPRPPSELADDLDLTPQNVHHHLGTLQEAELIEPVGTRYSEKGVEMSIYAPADDPLLVCSADESDRSIVREALTRLFGGAVAVGVATVAFAAILDRLRSDRLASYTVGDVETESVSYAARDGIGGSAISPELAFLLGGLVAVALVTGWWAVRRR